MAELMNDADGVKARGLKAVRVSRIELLGRVKQGLERHLADFKEADAGYKLAVVAELTQALENAKAGKEYKTYFSMALPQNHARDFERVIAMLEMSLEDTIDLPVNEFSRYVLDEWPWSHDFNDAKMRYSRG